MARNLPEGPDRAQLMNQVRATVTEDPHSWDIAWKKQLTPWDTNGQVQPALIEVFELAKLDLPAKGKALVPGCGRGPDVLYLASKGLDATGMDISETALGAAKELLKQAVDSGAEFTGTIKFENGDFFGLKLKEEDKYDVVYDYTFFVAIPPSWRPRWGSQMRSLVKPGGYLITLVFPLRPQDDLGPPHWVQPEHYVEVLGDGSGGSNPEGWEKVFDKEPEKALNNSDRFDDRHRGKYRMVVWKRI